MNQNDYTPDRTPTPAQIAAWADMRGQRKSAYTGYVVCAMLKMGLLYL